jgi:hypothetical protein
MPFHLKQATLTFLENLLLTAFVTAIFALSDYFANHNTIDWHQILLAVVVPVSVAILSSIKSFYQTKGDLAAVDIIDQLTPRIGRLEQTLLQLQLAPQAVQPPQPVPPVGITPTAPLPPPGAPKFTAPTRMPLSQQAQQLPAVQPPRQSDPDASFSLLGPGGGNSSLSSFPFQGTNQNGDIPPFPPNH